MKVLIVLAGNPPSKKLLQREIEDADKVLAVDGGFNVFSNHGYKPDLVLGDMDSANKDGLSKQRQAVLDDQDYTDLQKTLKYVQDTFSAKSLVFLGAGGERTDHMLNNLHIAATFDHSVRIIFKNELSKDSEYVIEEIYRVTSTSDLDLRVTKGSTLSILPNTQFKGLTATGLKWAIVNQDSDKDFISQSNQAIKNDPTFNLIAGIAYIAVYQ